MSDGTIAIDEPTSVDKQLDTTSLTVGANTVERERVVIAGASAADLAPVDATLGLMVNVADRALRDLGKVDIAAFDAALPAGTNNIGDVDVLTLPALPAGTNNIGDVDVLTVPADPFGANADAIVAAGAVGSIQAKLRRATQGLEDLKSLIVLAAGTNAIGKLAANSGVDIGDVDVTSAVATDFEHGSNRDVDTAAEQLPNQAAKFGVTVKAARNNTANIYVGKSDVTADSTDATDGFELGPGESLFLPVNNANLIYVIGGAVNQKVFWVAA